MLHYAPDNASLIVRLALDHRGLDYQTVLVDRRARAQEQPAFRAMNPSGQIPVLETPHGPMSETGAILLYLADTHGELGPGPTSALRAGFLKWLFFAANTLHPALRMMFYTDKYIAAGHRDALRRGLSHHLQENLALIDAHAASRPGYLADDAATVLDFYLAGLLRWPVLYPEDHDRSWFDLHSYPALLRLCTQIEALPATARLQSAEGLGDTPFTAPLRPTPPEGSAT
ncbi:glutathione S-transferase family protein [Sulfitobacter sp. JB4-11]|uniref:glutathione S-transferase family protein n=1 Tax=Sulfitobacter rhodophyticola TaxID=3238304 RepID=UPI0035196D95